MRLREDEIPFSKTLWMYFREGLRRATRARPVSFYLLLMMPVALVLGAHLGTLRTSPRRFAFLLGLLFLFFLAVMWRATVDFFDIVRRHMAERRTLYPSTLAEPEFLTKLGEQVRSKQDKLGS